MEKITLDEFCNIKYLSNLNYSKDGKNICFVVSNADKKKNCYHSYIYKLEGKKTKKLTTTGKESNYIFIDNETILYQSKRDKKEKYGSRFYKYSLKTNKESLAYNFPIPINKILPLKNNDLLLLANTVVGFEDLYKGDKKFLKKYQEYIEANKDYEEVNQVPFWHNGGTFTKSSYTSLYLYNHKNKKITRLTNLGFNVYDVQVKTDESNLYILGNEVKSLRSFDDASLYSYNLKNKELKEIVKSKKNYRIHGFALAKSFAYIFISDEHLGGNTDADVYCLDYKTNKIKKLFDLGYSIGSSVGSDVRYGDGEDIKVVEDELYFISTRFNSSYIYKYDGKTIKQLTHKEGSVDCFDVNKDKIVLVGLFDMMPQEIYDIELNKITSFNNLKNKYIAKPEKIVLKSSGNDIYGFVLKPYNYQRGKKYPVILDIHGGPKTVYGPVFYHEMQYWCSLGYFVIYCNPKGSDGRGDFMDIFGAYGKQDYADIMKFTNTCLNKYKDMDKDHLYETGGSYGGFMTNWIIGHTNKFKACVSQRSISNWFSFYGVSDIGVHFTIDQNKADPFNNPEKLWERSPMKYADKVKTPTLFIHSFEDYRCPIDQGYQMYTSLVAHGVDTKMVLFRGENHELSRSGKPLHRIKRLDEITKWFINHK